MTAHTPFWRSKTLTQMTPQEWESLCDGCGRCCLHKLEDEDTGDIAYTNVSCQLLDTHQCRCTNYTERQRLVPFCRQLTPEIVKQTPWLPRTCAYRLVAEGQDLAWWHPLVSGDPETVHQAGISVRGCVIPEQLVPLDTLPDYIIDWIEY